MISYVPQLEKVTEPLLKINTTIPADYVGIHASHWPINQRGWLSRTASGTINQNTITLSAADASIPNGAYVVTRTAAGTAIGAKVTNNVAGVLTLDKVNVATFASQTIEIHGTGLTESLGAIDASPSGMNYNWFRTHDSSWGHWCDHNPAPGVFFWNNPDLIYNQLVSEGKKILATLVGCPRFASARPLEANFSYGGLGGGAEPANMQHWVDYCLAIASRYPMITHYEIWNEPNLNAVPTKITTVSTNTITLAEVLNVACTGTSGVNTITLSSGNALLVEKGGAVTGTGIAINATVSGKKGNVITLSAVNAGTVTGNISFKSTSTGIAAGSTLMSSVVPVGTTVSSIAADKFTITLNNSATSSTTVTASFHTASNHFYSGTTEKLSEMIRLASQAIKSVNPSAKIMLTTGTIKTSIGTYSNAVVTSDGTTTTVYRNTHGTNAPDRIMITNAGSFNTPAGTYDVVTDTPSSHILTIARSTPVGSSSCTLLHNVSTFESLCRASASGFSYLGNDGTGTKALDWADIMAVHPYNAFNTNTVYTDLAPYKTYLVNMARPNMELWATEFGQGFVGSVTNVTITAGSNTAVITPSQTTDSLKGYKLMDANENLVGIISTNTGTSATLASPALITLPGGTFKFFTEAAKTTLIAKFMTDAAAAGFSKVFPYAWGHSFMGWPQDSASIDTLNQKLETIRGKQVVGVRGFKNGGATEILII